MLARSEPRTPRLCFAPEGKCSPALAAEPEPALGRGSSRSHPSLARNPSLPERSGESDPGAGASGERGGCRQSWPFFPPTTLPEHLSGPVPAPLFPGAAPRDAKARTQGSNRPSPFSKTPLFGGLLHPRAAGGARPHLLGLGRR